MEQVIEKRAVELASCVYRSFWWGGVGDVTNTHLKKHKSVAKTTRKVEHTNFRCT